MIYTLTTTITLTIYEITMLLIIMISTIDAIQYIYGKIEPWIQEMHTRLIEYMVMRMVEKMEREEQQKQS